jgi:hypothetical protein
MSLMGKRKKRPRGWESKKKSGAAAPRHRARAGSFFGLAHKSTRGALSLIGRKTKTPRGWESKKLLVLRRRGTGPTLVFFF